jgi:hypothetical protein
VLIIFKIESHFRPGQFGLWSSYLASLSSWMTSSSHCTQPLAELGLHWLTAQAGLDQWSSQATRIIGLITSTWPYRYF